MSDKFPKKYLKDEQTVHVWAQIESGEPDGVVVNQHWCLTQEGMDALRETVCKELGLDSIDDVYDHLSDEAIERHGRFTEGDLITVPIARVIFSKYAIRSVKLEDGITNAWAEDGNSTVDTDYANETSSMDPTTQLGFVCTELFPNEPVSLTDIEEHLSAGDVFDYVIAESDVDITEFIAISGEESCRLEFDGVWLGPHNASIDWEEHPDCETATEVADKIAIANNNWSILHLQSNSE